MDGHFILDRHICGDIGGDNLLSVSGSGSNKNVSGESRSGETPSLGEKSSGRSHSWGETLFGEKPFLRRSHFRGRSHSGEKPLKNPMSP